jgi:hypothetical protein
MSTIFSVRTQGQSRKSWCKERIRSSSTGHRSDACQLGVHMHLECKRGLSEQIVAEGMQQRRSPDIRRLRCQIGSGERRALTLPPKYWKVRFFQ